MALALTVALKKKIVGVVQKIYPAPRNINFSSSLLLSSVDFKYSKSARCKDEKNELMKKYKILIV